MTISGPLNFDLLWTRYQMDSWSEAATSQSFIGPSTLSLPSWLCRFFRISDLNRSSCHWIFFFFPCFQDDPWCHPECRWPTQEVWCLMWWTRLCTHTGGAESLASLYSSLAEFSYIKWYLLYHNSNFKWCYVKLFRFRTSVMGCRLLGNVSWLSTGGGRELTNIRNDLCWLLFPLYKFIMIHDQLGSDI